MNDKPKFGVQCPQCKRRIFSFSRHDFKFCGCENEVFIDGGDDYFRSGWKSKKPRRIKFDGKRDLLP